MSLSARRAWIEIVHRGPHHFYLGRSLSARRAWIEIVTTVVGVLATLVALRKESVDRNVLLLLTYHLKFGSLSARRAWIEITSDADWVRVYVSSLSARRAWIEIFIFAATKLR